MTFENDMLAVQRIAVVPAILDTICRLTGMGFATVARVTSDQWVACAVRDEAAFGLPQGGELPIETTFCDTVHRQLEPVVFDAASLDPVYTNHPSPALYGFESYISVPIILPDGRFFGTLCALGRTAARVRNPEIIGTFTMFAGLIAMHLDAIARTDAAEARLAEERAEAAERDRFIAILGHDLRNPIAAMAAGTRMLAGARNDGEARRIEALMAATLGRMRGLVDNVLDFARARMGGGIVIRPDLAAPLEPALRVVIAEMHAIEPDRDIEALYDLAVPSCGDTALIAQAFANLLSNALTHGSPKTPVRVEARSDAAGLTLAVANAGPPIPMEVQSKLFRPFSRGEAKPGHEGLGLGLYIAAEIARAHGGTLDLTTDARQTCFTLRIPA